MTPSPTSSLCTFTLEPELACLALGSQHALHLLCSLYLLTLQRRDPVLSSPTFPQSPFIKKEMFVDFSMSLHGPVCELPSAPPHREGHGEAWVHGGPGTCCPPWCRSASCFATDRHRAFVWQGPGLREQQETHATVCTVSVGTAHEGLRPSQPGPASGAWWGQGRLPFLGRWPWGPVPRTRKRPKAGEFAVLSGERSLLDLDAALALEPECVGSSPSCAASSRCLDFSGPGVCL